MAFNAALELDILGLELVVARGAKYHKKTQRRGKEIVSVRCRYVTQKVRDRQQRLMTSRAVSWHLSPRDDYDLLVQVSSSEHHMWVRTQPLVRSLDRTPLPLI